MNVVNVIFGTLSRIEFLEIWEYRDDYIPERQICISTPLTHTEPTPRGNHVVVT